MLVQQEERSPMDSPLTESGQWTDTGISTGELSGGKLAKPTTLEGLDSSNIDTEGDLSEFSPMNNEELVDSHSTEDTTHVSAIENKQKPFAVEESQIKEASTSPISAMKTETNDKAMSPMSQIFPESTDVGTQENIMKESCDVKLSPILFQQTVATSPIVSDAKVFADAASSPPKLLLISAATSPTEVLRSTSPEVTKPSSPEVVSESLEFEISMTDDDGSKASEPTKASDFTENVEQYERKHEITQIQDQMTILKTEELEFSVIEEKSKLILMKDESSVSEIDSSKDMKNVEIAKSRMTIDDSKTVEAIEDRHSQAIHSVDTTGEEKVVVETKAVKSMLEQGAEKYEKETKAITIIDKEQEKHVTEAKTSDVLDKDLTENVEEKCQYEPICEKIQEEFQSETSQGEFENEKSYMMNRMDAISSTAQESVFTKHETVSATKEQESANQLTKLEIKDKVETEIEIDHQIIDQTKIKRKSTEERTENIPEKDTEQNEKISLTKEEGKTERESFATKTIEPVIKQETTSPIIEEKIETAEETTVSDEVKEYSNKSNNQENTFEFFKVEVSHVSKEKDSTRISKHETSESVTFEKLEVSQSKTSEDALEQTQLVVENIEKDKVTSCLIEKDVFAEEKFEKTTVEKFNVDQTKKVEEVQIGSKAKEDVEISIKATSFEKELVISDDIKTTVKQETAATLIVEKTEKEGTTFENDSNTSLELEIQESVKVERLEASLSPEKEDDIVSEAIEEPQKMVEDTSNKKKDNLNLETSVVLSSKEDKQSTIVLEEKITEVKILETSKDSVQSIEVKTESMDQERKGLEEKDDKQVETAVIKDSTDESPHKKEAIVTSYIKKDSQTTEECQQKEIKTELKEVFQEHISSQEMIEDSAKSAIQMHTIHSSMYKKEWTEEKPLEQSSESKVEQDISKKISEIDVTEELVDTFVEELVTFSEKELQSQSIEDMAQSLDDVTNKQEELKAESIEQEPKKENVVTFAIPTTEKSTIVILQESVAVMKDESLTFKSFDEAKSSLEKDLASKRSDSDEIATILTEYQSKDKPDDAVKPRKELPEALILDEHLLEEEEVKEVGEQIKEPQIVEPKEVATESGPEGSEMDTSYLVDTFVEELVSFTEAEKHQEVKKPDEDLARDFVDKQIELDKKQGEKEELKIGKTKDDQQVSELMKGDDIDELFVLMMPPGQSSFDVKDHDDTEFDENNAPRHADEPSEALESKNILDLVIPSVKMGKLCKALDEKYAMQHEKLTEVTDEKTESDTLYVEKSKKEMAAKEEMIAQLEASEEINTTILKELGEEEQEESGFELTTKEVKSMDESTTAEQSLDLLQSDKTDSLFQSSTLNESAQTLSEHTLEAELPSDYDTTVDLTINVNEEEVMENMGMKEKLREQDKTVQEQVGEARALKAVLLEDEKSEQKVDNSEPKTEIEPRVEKRIEEEITTSAVSKESEVSTSFVSHYTTSFKTEQESRNIQHDFETETTNQDETIVKAEEDHKEMIKQDEEVASSDKVLASLTKTEDMSEPTGNFKVNDEITTEASDSKEYASKDDVDSKITRSLKDSVHVTTLSPSKVAIPQEKKEEVELIPNLNWDLKAKDELVPQKEFQICDLDVQGSLSQDQFERPPTESSSDARTGSSHDESSIPSSRMSERSGTQSSIELRTSSRSSHSTVPESLIQSSSKSSASATSSNISDDKKAAISESSGSPCMQVSSSSPFTEESTESSKYTTTSSSFHGKKQVTVTDSAKEYPAEDHETKSPTAQLRSGGEMSPQSLPSSPRHLRRTESNGVKKLTSEIFSTDNDLSRSLEIVYSEPSTDERRKLSERYRHTSSSSGASSGSVNNEQNKIEKRKASVTQVRKTEELACGQEESEGIASKSTDLTSSEAEMRLQHSPEPQEQDSKTSPIKEKKVASPTKIQTPAPAPATVQEKICSEEFSPMLQVECKTPESKITKG